MRSRGSPARWPDACGGEDVEVAGGDAGDERHLRGVAIEVRGRGRRLRRPHARAILAPEVELVARGQPDAAAAVDDRLAAPATADGAGAMAGGAPLGAQHREERGAGDTHLGLRLLDALGRDGEIRAAGQRLRDQRLQLRRAERRPPRRRYRGGVRARRLVPRTGDLHLRRELRAHDRAARQRARDHQRQGPSHPDVHVVTPRPAPRPGRARPPCERGDTRRSGPSGTHTRTRAPPGRPRPSPPSPARR